MKTMIHLAKGKKQGIMDVLVFDEDLVEEYLEDGFDLCGRYEVRQVEGSDTLPDKVFEA